MNLKGTIQFQPSITKVERPKLLVLVWFILRPCQHDDGYINGWSQIKVHNDEWTRFTVLGLPWRSPIQVLTEIDVA